MDSSVEDIGRMSAAADWMLGYAGKEAANDVAIAALMEAMRRGDHAMARAALERDPDPLESHFGSVGAMGAPWEGSAGKRGENEAFEARDPLGMALALDAPLMLGLLWDKTRHAKSWDNPAKSANPQTTGCSRRELLILALLKAAIATPAPSCAHSLLGVIERHQDRAHEGETSDPWWSRHASKVWRALAQSNPEDVASWMGPFIKAIAAKTSPSKPWRQTATAWDDGRDEIVVAKSLTPLQAACLAGHGSLAQALVDAGAHPAVFGVESPELALLWAGRRGYCPSTKQAAAQARCLDALFRAGAVDDAKTWLMVFNETCIDENDRPSLGVALARSGKHIDARDADHRTALMISAEHGSLATVQAVLDAGADPTLSAGPSFHHGGAEKTALFFAMHRSGRGRFSQDDSPVKQAIKRAVEAWIIAEEAAMAPAQPKPRSL